MKIYNKFFVLLICILMFSSCDHFEDINTNPDSPKDTPPSMLATGIILQIMKKDGNKGFIYDVAIAKQLTWNESAFGEQYNLIGTKDLDKHLVLTDCKDMLAKAKAANEDVDGYEALSLFTKAYLLYYTSMDLGDIPYSDVTKGEEGGLRPKYDTQKEVMKQILTDLETAYTKFSAAKTTAFSGDPLFNGNKEKWKKFVTAFQLKVLINLSKKVDDTDLNIKSKFASIVSSGSLMTSSSDNFQLVYEDKAGMRYPFNDFSSNQCKYAMHSSVLIDMLKKYDDYRLFYYAEPSDSLLKLYPSDDSSAYIGIDPSASFSTVSGMHGKKLYSPFNLRYTAKDHTVGEPLIRLGYGEQQLILAEACLRGWITGSAATYYKAGVKANMEFTRDVTPDKYAHNRVMTDTYIADYLASPIIQLNGDFDHDLGMIISQKYIAEFMQYPYEAWYDYRRTGLPVLPINPSTSQNSTATDKIPFRYRYANREYSFNRENLEESLARQFNGSDDINDVMWILK